MARGVPGRSSPGRWRTAGLPALVAGGGVAGALLLHFRDPHTPGSYGICPFYAVTGLWCPGCGGMRAVHNLTEGRVLDAVHSNVFVLPLLVTVVLWWGSWTVNRWRGSGGSAFPFTLRPRGQWMLAGVLVVFTVLRNTPWGTWLAPV
ncbi:MAG: DUF2752 domain-containing protein [Nocardia sp.]|nr:DUF2752 domain-containing protein [Nocardia sp.]